MSVRSFTRVIHAALFAILPSAGLADILIQDPYARASRPNAPTGAAFMVIENTGSADDRLISATSDVAQRVELHTHKDIGDGVMQMMQVEEGFVLAPGGQHALKRGGDHIMFMGLNQSLEQGDEISVTLIFEKAGAIEVTVPVDNKRMPKHGHKTH